MMVKRKAKIEIPPPPGSKASDDEVARYFEKYTMEDLNAAGYLRELSPAELKEMDELAAACQSRLNLKKNARTQFNLAMSAEQMDRFVRYANKKHIPPSTLAKAWILERLDQEAK
jgi:hypothetical protein